VIQSTVQSVVVEAVGRPEGDELCIPDGADRIGVDAVAGRPTVPMKGMSIRSIRMPSNEVKPT